ncbi:MAG: hypothetical protein JRG86_21130 [Deltaproteobacteria bacterium]|nr:hypothetical protein [Deltaproteobacteria bacterium]
MEKLMLLLQETVAMATREKLVSEQELRQVNVDTTVQEKNITHPTDSKDVPKDERAERFDTPQYQSPEDRIAAERRSHRPDCVFID